MNVANHYNEDGQRVEPERLYSPFIRLFACPKPINRKPKVKREIGIWEPAIREALAQQPMTFNQLFAKLSHVGTRKGCQKACAVMHKRYQIVYEGKHKSSIYRLTGK